MLDDVGHFRWLKTSIDRCYDSSRSEYTMVCVCGPIVSGCDPVSSRDQPTSYERTICKCQSTAKQQAKYRLTHWEIELRRGHQAVFQPLSKHMPNFVCAEPYENRHETPIMEDAFKAQADHREKV